MAIPPKGDPRRPLHLAIRSTRFLGILCLVYGSCSFLPMLMRNSGAPPMARALEALPRFLFYLAHGTAYLVFCIYMKQRKFWAVLGALILASIALILMLIGAGRTVIFFANLNQNKNAMNVALLIPITILALLNLAFAQLVYHLARSFEAIKYVPPEEDYGFEPLMVQPPVLPPMIDDLNPPSPEE